MYAQGQSWNIIKYAKLYFKWNILIGGLQDA